MKRKYFVIVILTLLMLVMFIPKITYAEFSANGIVNQAEGFINAGKSQNTSISNSDLASTFSPIAQILVAIGGGVVAIVTAIMAIKYMMANAEQRAKLKTQLVGLVIATCVIFGAQLIWSTLYNTLKNI